MGDETKLSNPMRVGQKRQLTCTPKTAAGDAAPVDGKVIWTIYGNAAHLEVEEGTGLVAWIIADQPGSVQVTASADADLSSGENFINFALDFEILPESAAYLEMAIGEAEDADPVAIKKKENGGGK